MDELGEHAVWAGVQPRYALHYTVRCIATNTRLHTYTWTQGKSLSSSSCHSSVLDYTEQGLTSHSTNAVLSSVCATTVDNSGVYVYYLTGIVSVCFRRPASTVGFFGIRLHCVCTTNQAEWRLGATHLLARQGHERTKAWWSRAQGQLFNTQLQVWFIPSMDERGVCRWNCEIPWERVPYLSALEVCSRRGAIQIHV